MEKPNGHNILILQWDMVLESDASKKGWGANHLGVSTGGLWTLKNRNITSITSVYLQLLAAFLALKTFVRDCHSGNTSLNQQCDSGCLCEQDGRSTFNPPLQPSCQNVEVVLQHGHICPWRASSKEGECESRVGVSACKGLHAATG